MFGATVSAATVINRVSNFWSGLNRVAKKGDFGHNQGKGFGKWAAQPHPTFSRWREDPGHEVVLMDVFNQSGSRRQQNRI